MYLTKLFIFVTLTFYTLLPGTLYHSVPHFFCIILFVFFFSNFYLSFAGKDFDLEIFSVVSVPFVDV